MAEIKVEKKKPIWPWIIAVLIVLAILYFLFANGDDDEVIEEDYDEQVIEEDADNVLEEDPDEEFLDENGDVADYLSYIGDESRMGIDHEYTNNAIIYLMNAVQSKADEFDVDIDADMQEIRQMAEAITRDPLATNHADKIRNVGMRLADVIENLQEEEFPDLTGDIQEVKSAVEEIDPAVLTLEQKDEVNQFFEEAGDVLNKMS